jgi:hypothetical protein
MVMSSVSVPIPAEVLEERVRQLLERWRSETAHLSSSTQMLKHPAYQEIISLGPVVLPFLFHDLEQTGDGHLSKALTAITGAHPVPLEDRGKVKQVAAAWLRWAKENGQR